MNRIYPSKDNCLESIEVDSSWGKANEKELKIHRIHAYPAKFPSFITSKAIDHYTEIHGSAPKRIADVFCGCGTVALEAKRMGINFWGCDINPVATMIAKAKCNSYNPKKLEDYYEQIVKGMKVHKPRVSEYYSANERIQYWYEKKQFLDLLSLKRSITNVIPQNSHYKHFFQCAFSNILKPSSRWLTKSIKPQVDPDKDIADVFERFDKQFDFMLKAAQENINDGESKSDVEIKTRNFLRKNSNLQKVNMIITSPPYVTSYEYADLHQLSSLWLGYTDDYRLLRQGTIGSRYQNDGLEKSMKGLNLYGKKVVSELRDIGEQKAKDVAKYYLDMQETAMKCHAMLEKNGMAVFIIGNTEYKKVRIDNARHLLEALSNSGFKKCYATKREISGKFLTPYRDQDGKFSTNKKGRKVYSEEFVVAAVR